MHTRVLLLTLLTGCQFEYRAPSGSRVEDAALQGVATSFYGALTRHDTATFNRVAWPTATVLLDGGQNAPTLVPLRTLLELRGQRSERSGVRLVRSDLRADGELATARFVIAAAPSSGQGEYEATDFLTLARHNGSWRIAHAVLGAWRPRTAP
ncbi:MAG: hypothetical protein V4503_05020 [Gemmatimonadota bacterium]